MIFLFVRHGLTDETAKGHQGRADHDVGLNKTGVEQANSAADICNEFRPKIIYSSPYLRTRQTAKILADRFGADIVIADELKEYQVGEWGELPIEEGRKKLIDAGMWNYNDKKYEFRPPGGESWKDVHQRTKGLVLKVMHNANVNDAVVFVTHNAAMKAIIGDLKGTGLKEWLPTMYDTGSVSCFEYAHGSWSELFVNKT